MTPVCLQQIDPLTEESNIDEDQCQRDRAADPEDGAALVDKDVEDRMEGDDKTQKRKCTD